MLHVFGGCLSRTVCISIVSFAVDLHYFNSNFYRRIWIHNSSTWAQLHKGSKHQGHILKAQTWQKPIFLLACPFPNCTPGHKSITYPQVSLNCSMHDYTMHSWATLASEWWAHLQELEHSTAGFYWFSWIVVPTEKSPDGSYVGWPHHPLPGEWLEHLFLHFSVICMKFSCPYLSPLHQSHRRVL